MNGTSLRTRLGSLVLLALVLLAWEWACRALRLSPLVLPAPSVIYKTLWNGLASGYFWPHIRSTGLELLLGLATGCIVGFASGLVMAESKRLRSLMMPYVVVSQVIPKLALMPLFIVWFGFGMTSTVVITALICAARPSGPRAVTLARESTHTSRPSRWRYRFSIRYASTRPVRSCSTNSASR